MASGHARLKKALVLRDALAHELGLDLTAAMRGLSTVEDTMTADLAMADGNYLRKLNDGDLVMIYGASTAETEKSLRSYVLGFLEVEATPIRDYEKASPVGLDRKRDAGWADKWTYAIPVRRAWRAEEKMMISRIAFNSYRSAAGQALAVHGADLDPDEIAQALKIKVREVNVYGEPPVNNGVSPVMAFAEVFRPSRAFPGSLARIIRERVVRVA